MGVTNKNVIISPNLATCLAVIVIALVAFLTYDDVLGYFFTAQDSLTLIATSRIESVRDLDRIFSEPMMNRTSFITIGKFYRPVSSLSFSLDYQIWALNSFGYHLTDLILHICVAVLIFFLIRSLTNGNQIMAWITAIIFATHPILVEIVPAISRRQDIIVTFFLLGSFLVFLKYNNATKLLRKTIYLFISISFYILALGAKEIAIIFWPLVLSHSVLFLSPPVVSLKNRIIKANVVTFPYAMTTIVIIAWRAYVIQGLGGYPNEALSAIGFVHRLIQIIIIYFVDLFYPVDFLRLEPYLTASKIKYMMYFSVLLLPFFFAMGFLFLKRQYTRGVKYHSSSTLHFLKCDHHLIKLALLFMIWTLLPLLIYLLTLNFDHRFMYIPVIPFSSILAITIVKSFQAIIYNEDSRYFFAPIFLLATGLSITLLAYSPLIKTNNEWRDSGRVSAMFLEGLSEIIPSLPEKSVIYVENLPKGITSYKTEIPHAKTVGYLIDHSIKAWLDLNFPSNQIEVVVQNRSWISTSPDYLSFQVTMKKNNDYRINVQFFSDENNR